MEEVIEEITYEEALKVLRDKEKQDSDKKAE